MCDQKNESKPNTNPNLIYSVLTDLTATKKKIEITDLVLVLLQT